MKESLWWPNSAKTNTTLVNFVLPSAAPGEDIVPPPGAVNVVDNLELLGAAHNRHY